MHQSGNWLQFSWLRRKGDRNLDGWGEDGTHLGWGWGAGHRWDVGMVWIGVILDGLDITRKGGRSMSKLAEPGMLQDARGRSRSHSCFWPGLTAPCLYAPSLQPLEYPFTLQCQFVYFFPISAVFLLISSSTRYTGPPQFHPALCFSPCSTLLFISVPSFSLLSSPPFRGWDPVPILILNSHIGTEVHVSPWSQFLQE